MYYALTCSSFDTVYRNYWYSTRRKMGRLYMCMLLLSCPQLSDIQLEKEVINMLKEVIKSGRTYVELFPLQNITIHAISA